MAGKHGGWLGRKMASDISAIRTPTDRELGWAAGFLEGEANFHKAKVPLKDGKLCRGGENIRCSQVNPDPLTLLQEIFGGRVNLVKVNTPKHNNYWHWSISGARARGVMMTLYPLMSSTRQGQIEAALRDA